MRKQHTFNALMAASFQQSYQDAMKECREFFGKEELPDLNDDDRKEVRGRIYFLLNHYEFLAAGIRNGDIHEKLLKDSERGTVIRLFETAENCGYVAALRDRRKRRTIFEHLEWLYERWEERPVPWWQRAYEWFINRPLYHSRSRWILLGALVVTAIVIILLALIIHF